MKSKVSVFVFHNFSNFKKYASSILHHDLPAVIDFLRLKNAEILINMEKQSKEVKIRGLTFELEIPKDIGQDEILCDTRCPYGPEFCTKLPDPRKIKLNPEYSFMDFCGEKLGNAIPVKGSLDILKKKRKT